MWKTWEQLQYSTLPHQDHICRGCQSLSFKKVDIKFQKIRLQAILQENIVGQRVLLTKKNVWESGFSHQNFPNDLAHLVMMSLFCKQRKKGQTYIFFILGSLEKWVKWVNIFENISTLYKFNQWDGCIVYKTLFWTAPHLTRWLFLV